ncbi:MAG: DNA ligase [Gammaproteobacteria bacterium]|nr:DNA ligase [Gammaproteobacteria bacterium]MCP5137663.1 DNA ligase [Gammaproteobacteria bacterium]
MRYLALLLALAPAAGSATPDLLLLETPKDADNCPPGWLISEKLDGIRAYWDGRNLRSRSGNTFAVPAWFTAPLPPFELDGELWTERNDFQRIASLVTRDQAHDGWRAIGYHIFEVPNATGGLMARLQRVRDWLSQTPVGHLHVIPQTPCLGAEHLKRVWDEVVAKGGEGLVLRNPSAPYTTGRSKDALKLKRFDDMEAVVIGHKPGQGRLSGRLGALLVELPDGQRLHVGTGFSDAERTHPPAIGSTVTFKHQGFTDRGLPRFPVFLHVRPDGT